jgi:hypothetical protein
MLWRRWFTGQAFNGGETARNSTMIASRSARLSPRVGDLRREGLSLPYLNHPVTMSVKVHFA